MARLARQIALQAEIEPTYGAGTGGGAWAAALQVLPVRRPNHRVMRMNENRELYTAFLGSSDEIPGPRVQEIEFEIELAGSGTPGTPPPWGKLLRACQFSETIIAGEDARVEYHPVSAPGESVVMRFWADGVAYIGRGSRGTVSFDLTAYQIPRARFRFMGFDVVREQAAALQPASPFSVWKQPILPSQANSARMRLGSGTSYTGAGGLSGGTLYNTKGLTLDMGHTLTYDPIIGAEKVVVTDRNPTGQATLELTAAQEVAWNAEMNDSIETPAGWRVGDQPGNTIIFFGRRLQRQEMQQIDDNGFVRADIKYGLILDKDDRNDNFMTLCVR